MHDLLNVNGIEALILLSSSFIGSLMTAAAGVGGGSFLIAVMADILPPLALIPVHGAVQMGSNVGRCWLTREHVKRRLVLAFALGALIGGGLAIYLLGSIDTRVIPLLIAGFILWLTWVPLPNIGLSTSQWGLALGGVLTTIASMLIGASGPLVAAWIGKDQHDRFTYIANFSFCLTVQHALKFAVFGAVGFVFWEWLPLIAMMIGSGYLGTKVGLRLLGKLPEKTFKRAYRVVLTLLALRIILAWCYR